MLALMLKSTNAADVEQQIEELIETLERFIEAKGRNGDEKQMQELREDLKDRFMEVIG